MTADLTPEPISNKATIPKIGLYKKWELIFTKDHKVKISDYKPGVWCAYKEETKPHLFAFGNSPREALENLAEILNYPTLTPS